MANNNDWLLVDLPLWNILVNGKDYPIYIYIYIMENKHVWNHQPVTMCRLYETSIFVNCQCELMEHGLTIGFIPSVYHEWNDHNHHV